MISAWFVLAIHCPIITFRFRVPTSLLTTSDACSHIYCNIKLAQLVHAILVRHLFDLLHLLPHPLACVILYFKYSDRSETSFRIYPSMQFQNHANAGWDSVGAIIKKRLSLEHLLVAWLFPLTCTPASSNSNVASCRDACARNNIPIPNRSTWGLSPSDHTCTTV